MVKRELKQLNDILRIAPASLKFHSCGPLEKHGLGHEAEAMIASTFLTWPPAIYTPVPAHDIAVSGSSERSLLAPAVCRHRQGHM